MLKASTLQWLLLSWGGRCFGILGLRDLEGLGLGLYRVSWPVGCKGLQGLGFEGSGFGNVFKPCSETVMRSELNPQTHQNA